jgi:hypothetical protein
MLISTLFYIPSALALESNFQFNNFGEFFSQIGSMLHTIVTNKYSAFFILAILLFIIFYKIFHAPLQKISIFQGASGKTVAVALALLSELGIFYKARETGLEGLLSNVFGANNLLVGVIFAILIFLFFRKILGN